MKKALLITLFALLLPHTSFAFDFCTAPSREVHESIVKIVGNGVAGSGVVVQHNQVVTAAHVLDGLETVKIEIGGESKNASVIAIDAANDLALLHVNTDGIKPLVLRREPLSKNEGVWALGFAFGKTFSSGKGQYKKDYQNLLYTSAPVNYGQSGGGLIACEGGRHVLAGVIRAFGAEVREGKLIRRSDISVAAKPQSIRTFLSSSNQLASAQ